MGALWRESTLSWSIWISKWYYTSLSIMLILFMVVYMVLWLKTPKTYYRWMSVFWLWILSYEISITSCIGYDIKSSKMIVWSTWDLLSLIFKEIVSRNKMWWNPWPRWYKKWFQKNDFKILDSKRFQKMISWWFPPCISTNLSDRLWFDS